jgi:polyphenol oxidase
MKETICEQSGVSYIRFGGAFTSIKHGFSLRKGGVSRPPYDTLNTGFHVGDDEGNVAENRHRLALALEYSNSDVVTGQQVHGTAVEVAGSGLRGRGACSDKTALSKIDGLVCIEPGVVLMCHAADCTIIFLYDPKRGSIGLAHAGWRGAVSGMGSAMVSAMAMQGSRPDDVYVALSPTIGPCCYRVGEDVAQQVARRWHESVLIRKEEGLFFDLPELQRLLLIEAGIREERVNKSMYCTCCHGDKFFSYRAAGGQTGRMAAVISL